MGSTCTCVLAVVCKEARYFVTNHTRTSARIRLHDVNPIGKVKSSTQEPGLDVLYKERSPSRLDVTCLVNPYTGHH